MEMKNYAKMILMATFAVLLMTTFATAESHPAYLHALTDLRYARAHLNVGTGNYRISADEQRAIGEIDAAIHEVNEAAINDGKPMGDHPPVDAGWSRTDRLHRAMELLDKARMDIDQHESDGYARGLKHRALHHIDIARKAVHDAIKVRDHE
jgi:hypothetical protein